MAVIKKPYEISVWQDVLVYVGKKYKISESREDNPPYYEKESSYYEVGRLFIDDFNNNKTNYYTWNGELYIRCNVFDTYNPNTTYYAVTYTYTEIPSWLSGCYILSGDRGEDINEFGEIEYQYYDERRIATIGSNTMTSPARAINPNFTRNINGTETLKFDMYYQYIDPITGEKVHNPLIDLVINERKIKLKYDDDDPNHTDGWFDFIVRKDDEKARDNKYSFTCTSLAINELSKTGFNIELDNELQNNMGTIKQLAEKILVGSDWQVGTSDVIQQKVNEALYKIKIKSSITAHKYNSNDTLTIEAGKFIYIYYTPYNIQEPNFLQFIYIPKEGNIKTLSDHMTIVCDNTTAIDCYMLNTDSNKVFWWKDNILNFLDDIDETNFLVTNYRGDRLVRKQKTAYDPVLKKVVKEYKDNADNVVYGYLTTNYLDVKSVFNYIHNSSNFSGTSYWTSYNVNSNEETYIDKIIDPPITQDNAIDLRTSYLKVKIGSQDSSGNRSYIKNDGIVYNYSKIDTFNYGETYLLRVKVKLTTSGDYLTSSSNFPFNCLIKKYENVATLNDDDGVKYFEFNGSAVTEDVYYKIAIIDLDIFDSNKTKYYYKNGDTYTLCTINSTFSNNIKYYTRDVAALIKATCLQSASFEDLKKNMGIFFIRRGNRSGAYYIEEVQFYKGILNGAEYMHVGDIPLSNFEIIDHYYYKDANKGYTKPEEYEYITTFYYTSLGVLDEQLFDAKIDQGITLYVLNNNVYSPVLTYTENTTYYVIANFVPLYGSDDSKFEKIRSITGKESNKFNLLQTLCETFECWAKFEISHETNGKIKILCNDECYFPIEVTKKQFANLKNGLYVYDLIDNKYVSCANDEYDANRKYFEVKLRYRQLKEVVFYGEKIETNYLGFKYGINLKDITRSLDSDLIVTKIIVKNNTQSAAKNGFCSIARAQDNPSKENFIYNFDYYTKMGIINKSTLNVDLFMPNFKSGYIGLYPKLRELNDERNDIIDAYTELGKNIPGYTSDKEQAALTRNAADENLQKLTNSKTGTIRQYSGYIYEDFYDQVSRKKNSSNYVPAYSSLIYWIKKGKTNEDNGDLTRVFVKKSDNTEVEINVFYKQINWNAIKKSVTVVINGNNSSIDGLPDSHYTAIIKDGVTTGYKFNSYGARYYRVSNGYYHRCANGEEITTQDYYDIGYTNKTPFHIVGDNNKFESISSALSTTGDYFLQYRASVEGERAKIVYSTTNKYISNIFFQTPTRTKYIKFYSNSDNETIAKYSTVYIYGARKRLEDVAGFTVRDNTIIRYLELVSVYKKEKETADADYAVAKELLDEKLAEYDAYEVRLGDIAKATEEIENEFLHKYSRYIQEGSWIDENYMDDDLYYLDATLVLYQSAYPKVSYTINVLELSALEGYEAYKFGIAHKTYIEDTEFFGWTDSIKNNPAREEVIVTEITVNFDEPDKNTIKVQNYRSHFEELFQRITATTQQLQLHSGEYGRASEAITPEGTIELTVISRTMASASYIVQNAYNQSVKIDDSGLVATKLSDPAQVVVLTSGGLLVSVDGGETYGAAITGYGINTSYLSAGTIDVDNVNLMSGAYPTFKWDSKGLRALSYTSDVNNVITNYDSSKYVTFDRFGIYGINGIVDFAPQNETLIEKNASFALTWNGFFLRSNYRNGYVSINPQDDIALYSYGLSSFELVGVPNSIQDFNEIYYLSNRSAFYYKNGEEYVKCTTELYDEISNLTLYTNYYKRYTGEYPTETLWRSANYRKNYFYLNNGVFTTCYDVEEYDETLILYIMPSELSNNGLTAIKRAKFGMLGHDGSGQELYGMALYNASGDETLTTQSNGTLWLKDSIRIGDDIDSNGKPKIYIGRGEYDNNNRWKVIRVYNSDYEQERFVLYSDGEMRAINGIFLGTITATSGYIGSNEITEYGLVVKGENGIIIDESAEGGLLVNGTSGIIINAPGGLDIYQGGITIYKGTKNNPGDAIFYVNQNGLLMEGSGKFTGNITASSGNIGGFGITDNEIRTLNDDSLILHSEGPNNDHSYIKVTDIRIGNQAFVEDFLKVGNMWIKNPEKYDSALELIAPVIINKEQFEENKSKYWVKDGNQFNNGQNTEFNRNTQYYVKYFELCHDGNLYGNDWSITRWGESSHAVFDYIHAKNGYFSGTVYARDGVFSGEVVASVISAATINTMNFVTEQVRSMGGAFVFKPTFGIKEINPAYEEVENGDYSLVYEEVLISEEEFNLNKVKYWQIGYIETSVDENTFNANKEKYFKIDNIPITAELYEIYKDDPMYFVTEEKITEYTQRYDNLLEEQFNDLISLNIKLYVKNENNDYIEVQVYEGVKTYYANVVITYNYYLIDYINCANEDFNELTLYYITDYVRCTINDTYNYKKYYKSEYIYTEGLGNYKILENELEIILNFTNSDDVNYFNMGFGYNKIRLDPSIDSDRETIINNINNFWVLKFNSIRNCVDQNDYENNIKDKCYYLDNNDGYILENRNWNSNISSKIEYYEPDKNMPLTEQNIDTYKDYIYSKDIIISVSGTDTRYGKITDDGLDERSSGIIKVYFGKMDMDTIINPDNEYSTFTLFGHSDHDLVIGINSDNNRAGLLMGPRALSMSYFSSLLFTGPTQTGYLCYDSKLVLGDLSTAREGYGYGLYSEDVFLKGAITTLLTNNSIENIYAGINTLSKVGSIHFPFDNPGSEKIVIWAGAQDDTSDSIRNSPFYVTANGSIYASKGQFEGIVMSKSLIANTEILAPTIRGTGYNKDDAYNDDFPEQDVSLKITDLNNLGGLGFYQSYLYKKVTEGLTGISEYYYKNSSGNFIKYTNISSVVWSNAYIKKGPNAYNYRDYILNSNVYEFDDILKLKLNIKGFEYLNSKNFITFDEDNQHVQFYGYTFNVGDTEYNTILEDGKLKKSNSQLLLNNDNITLKYNTGNLNYIEINNQDVINKGTNIKMVLGNRTLTYKITNGYLCLYVL